MHCVVHHGRLPQDEAFEVSGDGEQGGLECAVERRFLLAGANPAQQLSTCRQPDYAAFAAQGFECPGFFAGIIGIITVISGSPTGCRPA